jgi:hypothetical protein
MNHICSIESPQVFKRSFKPCGLQRDPLAAGASKGSGGFGVEASLGLKSWRSPQY